MNDNNNDRNNDLRNNESDDGNDDRVNDDRNERTYALLLLCWIKKCWYVLAISGYVVEKRRQIMGTNLPLIFSSQQQQPSSSKIHNRNEVLQSLMSSLFLRNIRPTLFIGTRSWINSTWAFWKKTSIINNNNCQRTREIMTMSHDNATIAMDWEFPDDYHPSNDNDNDDDDTNINNIDSSSLPLLDRPVVLILHGINTDASFGYIRSFMKSCTNNGWIAAGMNLRGYGNINITTPRLQHMAYTNDLRNVIHKISSRMANDNNIFLVGYSLGANIIVKYLGEEGTSSTLPKCVAGAVSLGNPFKYVRLKFPWDIIIGLGSKKELWKHYNSLQQMTSPYFQKTLNTILFGKKWMMNTTTTTTVGVDDNNAYHHHQIRNNPSFPFETKVGYASEAEFAKEAGSYQYAANVSIPLLIIVASDDTIAIDNTMTSFPYFLSNPNIIIVTTKTGGHLGWHTSPKNNPFHIVNWADATASKFISSLLNMKKHNTTDEMFQNNITTDYSASNNKRQPKMISRL